MTATGPWRPVGVFPLHTGGKPAARQLEAERLSLWAPKGIAMYLAMAIACHPSERAPFDRDASGVERWEAERYLIFLPSLDQRLGKAGPRSHVRLSKSAIRRYVGLVCSAAMCFSRVRSRLYAHKWRTCIDALARPRTKDTCMRASATHGLFLVPSERARRSYQPARARHSGATCIRDGGEARPIGAARLVPSPAVTKEGRGEPRPSTTTHVYFLGGGVIDDSPLKHALST